MRLRFVLGFNINPFLSRGKPLSVFRQKKRETSCVSHNIFMHRRCASYILMLDEQSSQAQNVLHTPSGVLHKNAFSDEAATFHFAMKHCSVTLHNMKHSAHAPYDEKMKNKSFPPFAIFVSLNYIIP